MLLQYGNRTWNSVCCRVGYNSVSEIDRYTLDEAKVRLCYSLTLADGTIETIPMGIYEITEANRGVRTLEIKGYDYMLRFEKH